jgi:hypothetical protein
MAKTFKGFTNQQTHQLLKEMGFTGPAQKDEMDAFLASSPSAASKMGRYTEIAKQRVEGGPLSGVGMQQGGQVLPDNVQLYNTPNSTSGTEIKGSGFADQDISRLAELEAEAALMRRPDTNSSFDNLRDNTELTSVGRPEYKSVSRIVEQPMLSQPSVSGTALGLGVDIGGKLESLYLPDKENPKSDDQIKKEYAAAQEEARKKRASGFMGRVILPGEMSYEDFAGMNKYNLIKNPNVPEHMFPEGAASPDADPKEAFAIDPNAVPFKDPAGQGPLPSWITPPPPGSAQTMGMETLRNPVTGETYTVPSGGYSINQGASPKDTGTLKPSGITPSYNYTYEQALARQAQMDVKSPEEARAIKIALDMGPDAVPAPEGAQVLKPGTPTPEVSPAAELLDVAQETYASSTRDLTAIQQAMSGKAPEDVYKTRDYTSVADGTDDERRAAGTALAEKLLQHVTNTTPLTPEEITKYDLNGDGQVTISDVTPFQQMAVGLSEPNEAFTEFFLNKYPTGDVTYQQALEEAELAQTQAAANVSAQEAAYKIEDIPSTAEALGKAITNPSSVLSQPTVYGLKVENNQLIDEGTGQVATAASLLVKQAQAADAVEDPAVKATMAYLNKFSDQELQEKYPLPEFDYILLPYETLMQADEQSLSREQLGIRRSFFDKLQQRQAQIEQDAIADRAETYEAVMSQDKVKTALETFAAATGTPSNEALMKAETMDPEELAQLGLDAITLDTIRQIPEMKRQLDEGEIPTAALFDEYTKSEAAKLEGEVEEIDPAKFETETPKAEAEVDYNLPPTKVAETEATKVEDAAKFDEYATAEEKKSEFVPEVTAEETVVGADEIVDVNKIVNEESVIVTGKTLEALNEASTAKAATATFTQQLAAKAVKGEVSASSTVQYQMEKLMTSFDDGTPAWAAGALRKANAAMSARGLGNSSMASAAIIQATLESAIPIAQQDAATFAAMDMENVRNEQAVALANAAAAQNFELANLSNEQAVRIQNSMNNANSS